MLISAEDKKRSDPDTSKNYVQSFAGDNDKKLSEFDVSFGKQDLLKRQNLEFMRSKQCYAYEDMNKFGKAMKGHSTPKAKVLNVSKSARSLADFNNF